MLAIQFCKGVIKPGLCGNCLHSGHQLLINAALKVSYTSNRKESQ